VAVSNKVGLMGKSERNKTVIDNESSDSITGLVLTRARTGLLVQGPDGKNVWCRVPGKGSKTGMPVPGDRVHYKPATDTKDGWITGVEERDSLFRRFVFGRIKDIASNLEQVIVIATPADPVVSPRMVDRIMVGALVGKLKPILVLNKIDLFDETIINPYLKIWEKVDLPVLKVSALTGEGLVELEEMLTGKTSLLFGASGVGKSTILNKLMADLDLDTSSISEASGRGVHTTTSTYLYPLPSGGIVADTPGVREFYPVIDESNDLRYYFPEFEEFQDECGFEDCLHLENSADCAITKAVESGDISKERYESYLLILASLIEGPQRGRTSTQGKKYYGK